VKSIYRYGRTFTPNAAVNGEQTEQEGEGGMGNREA